MTIQDNRHARTDNEGTISFIHKEAGITYNEVLEKLGETTRVIIFNDGTVSNIDQNYYWTQVILPDATFREKKSDRIEIAVHQILKIIAPKVIMFNEAMLDKEGTFSETILGCLRQGVNIVTTDDASNIFNLTAHLSNGSNQFDALSYMGDIYK